jgi:hypothetical protein
MSNLKAIAALDAAIDTLTNVRNEMQAQHDETIAAIGAQKPTGSQPSSLLRLFRRW